MGWIGGRGCYVILGRTYGREGTALSAGDGGEIVPLALAEELEYAEWIAGEWRGESEYRHLVLLSLCDDGIWDLVCFVGLLLPADVGFLAGVRQWPPYGRVASLFRERVMDTQWDATKYAAATPLMGPGELLARLHGKANPSPSHGPMPSALRSPDSWLSALTA